jgi:hypothetical protein
LADQYVEDELSVGSDSVELLVSLHGPDEQMQGKILDKEMREAVGL